MSKILVTRISSFGDVAMLVPVVYSVAAINPHDRFYVLTRKAFAPLFENLGFNVSTRSFDVKRHSGFLGLIKLTLSISRSNYTHVADVHDVLRTKFIRNVLWLMGKKVAHIDKGRNDKNTLIKTKTLYPPLKHTIIRYQEVFEKIGFPAEITFTDIFQFHKKTLYPLRNIVKQKDGKWIGIAPFAKHKGKIYPSEKMEKILSCLSKNPENHIFLFSSGDYEKSIVDQWVQRYPNTISTSGKLNLENEMLLISFLNVMISMDSANMHLASLVQTPVVSIWGATHPSLGFYGYKQDISDAVQVDLPCRPCSVFGNLPCIYKDYRCLEMVNESAVLDKVEKYLCEDN